MNGREIIDTVKEYGMITHGGRFHADDVFCTALLQIVCKDNSLWPQRVFQVPENTKALVYDIGFGEFDHHQESVPRYANNKKKASFGLLSEKIIPFFYSQEVYENLLEFILDLDEQDNYGVIERTGEINPISTAVSAFNSKWDSEKTSDECFKEAVVWSRMLLENMIAREISKLNAKEAVKKSKRKGGILLLDTFLPWKDYVGEDIKYAVYPSNRGGYNIQVNPNTNTKLPERWLEEQPEGCLFVHRGLFLAQFETIEKIEQALKEVSS